MKYTVLVKLHAKGRAGVEEIVPGELVVRINAKPHDGEANREVVKLLAKHFRVPKTEIKIISGAHSRQKIINIPVLH